MRTSCSTASMKTGFGQLRHRHAVGRTLEAPCIGVGAEQVHAAVVALVGLEAFKNLLRVMQHGQRRIEREIGAGFDPRVMPALRLVVADDRHVIGENPAEAGIHQLCRAVLLGGRTSRGLDVEFQAHCLASRSRSRRDFRRRPVSAGLLDRNCHGRISRIDAGSRACAAALLVDAWPCRRRCGRFPRRHILRTCFCGMRKSSMFCRNAARQSYGSKLAALLETLAATSGLVRPSGTGIADETT